jgi:gamma-glutamyltranspeptidase/glutathione hydrolase
MAVAAITVLAITIQPVHALKHTKAASGVVASADTFASAAGLAVLERGGNAVDAAIATALALAVTYPRAGNIGGGGFMLIRLAAGDKLFIDYRETAARAARRDMYLDSGGEVIDSLSLAGHLASGVPGTIAGLALAHRLHGTIPWKELVEPAVQLAKHGFPVARAFIEARNEEQALLRPFESTWRIFGREFAPGDTLVQPDLARTLERIMNAGEADFYRGETAALIVAEMSRGGGIITAEDLREYRAVAREPLTFTYRGYEILSAPLPSSGGLILSILCSLIEPFDVGPMGFHSAEAVHLSAEAMKIVYLLRARHMGDSDFYPAPWRELISPAYVARLQKLIDSERALPVGELESFDLDPDSKAGGGKESEPEETTHFSIIDQWGNAVSNTYTLNGSFGSGVTVTGAGFLLNNEMDDFSIKPGFPNLYGLVGGEANAIEAGKRMLSSMTPAIVLRDGGLSMVLGTPGGSKIPTTVFQVLSNVIDYEMSLADAVRAPRYHEQYLPDKLYVEAGALAASAREALARLGHTVTERSPMCDVQAIIVDGDSLVGVSDPRGSGCAAGY